MNNMIVNIDYKFRDELKEDTVPIELLTGPYKGVVYRYTHVSLKEKEDDSAVMNFDYHLHETAEHKDTDLISDHRFIAHIGLILNQLILEVVSDDEENMIVEEEENITG
jgi:hypothetical protein